MRVNVHKNRLRYGFLGETASMSSEGNNLTVSLEKKCDISDVSSQNLGVPKRLIF